MREVYHVIIVGAGPAGLSSALACVRFGLNTLVLESSYAGGAPFQNYGWKVIEDILGLGEVLGREFSKRIVTHALRAGVKIQEEEEVQCIEPLEEMLKIRTEVSEYVAKSVVLATGTIGSPRKLGLKNEDLEGVHYYVNDPTDYKDKKVLVVGGGDAAIENAIGLAKGGARVTLAHRRESLRAIDVYHQQLFDLEIDILWNTELEEIMGEDLLDTVRLTNNKTGEEDVLKIDHIFVFIGSVLKTEWMRDLGLELEEGRLKVDENMRTNMKGIFAAGDITGELKRIPNAIAQGQKAAYSVCKYVRKPYWA